MWRIFRETHEVLQGHHLGLLVDDQTSFYCQITVMLSEVWSDINDHLQWEIALYTIAIIYTY